MDPSCSISSIQMRSTLRLTNHSYDRFGVNFARLSGGCTAWRWSIATSNSRVGFSSPLISRLQLTCFSDILLTRDLSAAGSWSSGPLVKLTDFGLSRFVDPDNPWLTTRCGSESYAAPEIVMGGQYDGRHTDAWACGVVLYALTTRRLPFDSLHGGFSSKGRKTMLLRIAKCEYSWPKGEDGEAALWQIPGVKRIVERLLVRDPQQRWKIDALWQDEWMNGEGAPAPPPRSESPPVPQPLGYSPKGTYMPELPAATFEFVDGDEDEDEEDDEDGLIIGEAIPSVATQENF